ncbi:hypothetical protein COOONC_01791 [Cooperia oncophora]
MRYSLRICELLFLEKCSNSFLCTGGPGGGKTRHAARIANSLADQGLVHICMPDVIRSALSKYKDQYSEWKKANEHYLRGWFQLIFLVN